MSDDVSGQESYYWWDTGCRAQGSEVRFLEFKMFLNPINLLNLFNFLTFPSHKSGNLKPGALKL